MDKISKWIGWVADSASRIAGLSIVVMALLIAVDVITRKIFSVTLLSGGVGELSGYCLAIVSFWGASTALLRRAHIRIDVLDLILPRKVATSLDFLALGAFTVASAVITYFGFDLVLRSYRLGSRSMTPLAVELAYPQTLWLLGLVMFTLVCGWLLIYCASLLWQGKGDQVQRHIGPKSTNETLEETHIAPQHEDAL